MLKLMLKLLLKRRLQVDLQNPIERSPHGASPADPLFDEPAELILPPPSGSSSGLIRSRPSRLRRPAARPFS